MKREIDFTVINAIYDVIAPLIKAHGQDKPAITKFVLYLLIIAAALADQCGVTAEHFRALAVNAFSIGRKSTSKDSKAN